MPSRGKGQRRELVQGGGPRAASGTSERPTRRPMTPALMPRRHHGRPRGPRGQLADNSFGAACAQLLDHVENAHRISSAEGEDLLVQMHHVGGDSSSFEVSCNASGSRLSHLPVARRVGERGVERAAELARIIGFDEKPGLAVDDQLRDAAHAVATTGNPTAIASRIATGRLSARVGRTNTSKLQEPVAKVVDEPVEPNGETEASGLLFELSVVASRRRRRRAPPVVASQRARRGGRRSPSAARGSRPFPGGEGHVRAPAWGVEWRRRMG